MALCLTAQRPPREVRAAQLSSPGDGFKITFGLKQKLHGRSWAGVLRDPGQVRSIRGWHLDSSDTITPPSRWNVTLRSVGADTPAKAILLEVASPPDRPVVVYTRDGDFSFTPAQAPYGVAYDIPELNGDVSVERVPIPRTVSTPEFEDDDPALLKTRGGEYWLAWVAYKTLSRKGPYIDGGDQILVARSRDGASWSKPAPLTVPGDHFRVALAEDGRSRVWCVYGAQKKMESGNFDLYARVVDGQAWSGGQ